MDFRWISDDYLSDIMLNGVSLAVNNLAVSNPWMSANAVDGVMASLLGGSNTIEFLVWNTGGNQPGYEGVSGPAGLAADFTVYQPDLPGIAQVPEPGSLALIGLALAGMAGVRVRRS